MNMVSILGRLVNDPEQFKAKNGFVTTFTLAFTDTDRSIYIPVLTFGKIADAVSKHLKKGSQVAVSGRLTNRSIKGEKGSRNVVEVIAERVDFLSSGAKFEKKPDEEIPDTTF